MERKLQAYAEWYFATAADYGQRKRMTVVPTPKWVAQLISKLTLSERIDWLEEMLQIEANLPRKIREAHRRYRNRVNPPSPFSAP